MALENLKLPFCISLLFISTVALGQSNLPDSVLKQLDEVVITGTRIKQGKGRIPASLSIISRSEIAESQETNVLPLLTRKVPGLFLQERSITGFGVGPASGGAITLRGIGGTPNTQVLVLIDGQPQFMGLFGHPIQDAYMASDIERIEVIRGPGSILYGSNAMGGTINLITRKTEENGVNGAVNAAVGSFGTQLYQASLGYRQNKLSVFTAFNHNRTQGHRKDATDRFQTSSAYLKLGYQLHSKWQLNWDASLSDSEFFDPGTTEDNFTDHNYAYLRGRTALSLENTHQKIEGAFKAFYNFGDHSFFDGWNSTDVNRGYTFYQNLKLLKGNIITLGSDFKDFGGEATNPNINLDENHALRELDFYGLIQQYIGEQFTATVGYRLVNNSQFGLEHIPQFGLAWRPAEATALKANLSKGFRSPTVIDFFVFPVANANLLPEQMWNYELSLLQTLLQDKLSLELTYYYIDGQNLILTLPTGRPGPPQKVNSGAFTNQGVEFQGSWQATASLGLSANYSYLNMENPLPFAPEHQLNLQANYQKEAYSFSVGFRQISGLLTAPGGQEESYGLLNARVSVLPKPWLNLYIRGENLLGTSYFIQQGYPMPEISFIVGAGVKF